MTINSNLNDSVVELMVNDKLFERCLDHCSIAWKTMHRGQHPQIERLCCTMATLVLVLVETFQINCCNFRSLTKTYSQCLKYQRFTGRCRSSLVVPHEVMALDGRTKILPELAQYLRRLLAVMARRQQKFYDHR